MADYQKLINTEVTFTATDSSLTSWRWVVDNVPESTDRVFKKTFTSLGIHTVTLEGTSCAACIPVSHTVEIVESVTPPAGGAGDGSSIVPIIAGVVVVVAALGIIMMAGRK